MLMTISCFSSQLEFDFKKLSDDDYNSLIEEYKDQEFKVPRKIGICRYCEINEHFAVFSQESGSGMWVYNIYILVSLEKGEWKEVLHCVYSTAEPKKEPRKVRFENNVISVLTGKDKFLTSFEVSDVLDQINNK